MPAISHRDLLLGILLALPGGVSARQGAPTEATPRPDPGFRQVLFIRRPGYRPVDSVDQALSQEPPSY